jgi:hypothetical protein
MEMRDQEEIEDVLSGLSNRPSQLTSMGDTFKYGYLMGKIVALGWVLEESSADMSIDYDFEDWWRELHDITNSKHLPGTEENK